VAWETRPGGKADPLGGRGNLCGGTLALSVLGGRRRNKAGACIVVFILSQRACCYMYANIKGDPTFLIHRDGNTKRDMR
jgi:hypothetical protein